MTHTTINLFLLVMRDEYYSSKEVRRAKCQKHVCVLSRQKDKRKKSLSLSLLHISKPHWWRSNLALFCCGILCVCFCVLSHTECHILFCFHFSYEICIHINIVV